MPTRRMSQPKRLHTDKPLTDYSIWTLAYCQADMPYDFFGGSGLMSNRGTIQIPMIYTVLVGGEVGGKKHTVLVDVGFGNQEWMSRYKFFAWEDPKTVLGKVGFTPEDVDAILVTHLHFDHIGNFGRFLTLTSTSSLMSTWDGCEHWRYQQISAAGSERGSYHRLIRKTFTTSLPQ